MGKKRPFVELAAEVASAINFEHGYVRAWPYKYRAIEPSPGVRLITEEDADQTLVEVPPDHLANRIVAWLRLGDIRTDFTTLRNARQIVEMWLAITEPIREQDIKHIRWRSDPGYTWRRLPWDMERGETPTWDAMLCRMENAAAFKTWLGSLFFEDAKQHQYIWCHGMGNDGKGAINRFLADVFGKSYRSKQPPGFGDKFWTYGLIGSRLVVFPDCNNQSFVSSGLFKSLSGGDPVDVEAKGRMSFTARLKCKFLFFSNERPNITSEGADMRRIIYCPFSEAAIYEQGFEEALYKEGASFLTKCIDLYEKNCNDHSPIKCEADGIMEWISVLEEQFQAIFDSRFMQPHPDYRKHGNLSELTNDQIDLVTVKPEAMLEIVNGAFKDNKERSQFRDWLYKKYGVQKKGIESKVLGASVFYRYVGVAHKLSSSKSRVHQVYQVLTP